MGNEPSRKQVIEIKKVEIVKKPRDERSRAREEEARRKEREREERRRAREEEARRKEEREREERRKAREEEARRKEERDRERAKGKGSRKSKEDSKGGRKGDKNEGSKEGVRGKEEGIQKEPQVKQEPGRPRGDGRKEMDKKKKAVVTEPTVMKPLQAESEPTMESATSIDEDLLAKKENFVQKLLRVTGINQMPVKSFIILFILWSLRFFNPWVVTWWNFNLYLLADPAHMAVLDSYFFTHEVIAFIGTCFICIMFSIFADVFNLKYYIYLFFIVIFILCPITGLVAINYLWARGYARQVYHKHAAPSIVGMNWAMSIPFVAFPLEFCCFFTQVDDMSREAHYNWSAIFVFLDVLNKLIAFFVIPGKCPTLQWTLASVWIAIAIVIHTVFLLSCFSLLWVKYENKVLNRTPFVLKVVKLVNRMLAAIKMPQACRISDRLPDKERESEFNSKATPFMKKMKLILLGLMLIPIIFATFVIAIMHRLELDEEWDRHEFHSATSMFIFGRVLGVLVVAGTLFLLRRQKKIKFLNRYSVFRPDVMALGLPHVLIVLALIILTGRFASLHSLSEGDIIIGPVPAEGRSVIEFYNADFRNRTVCVFSEKFRPVKVRPRTRETRAPPNPGVTKYEVSVTLAPRTTPPVVTHEILEFEDNSLITYVISLNLSESVSNDLEALYNKFLLFKVKGTEKVIPKIEPQLILINTFLLNTSAYNFYINQFQENITLKIPVPERTEATVVDLVPGRVDVVYKNDGGNNTQDPTPPVRLHFNMGNFSVYSVVLGLAHAMKNTSNETEPFAAILKHHHIMEIAGPGHSSVPSKRELQQDVPIMVAMVFGGFAESGLFIGIIYLFWLDTPIGELRVTTLAFFTIAIAVPQQFPRLKLVDITTGIAVFLLCLQIMFTVMHFIGAAFLYDEAFNFRKRSD